MPGAGALGAGALGAGALGAGAGVEGQGPLSELRSLVMQNPSLIQPMIQQLAQSNPNLAQYLEQNPEALLQILGTMGGEGNFAEGFDDGEAAEGGALPPGTHVVQITPEERAAIERVCIYFIQISDLDINTFL